MKRAICYCVDHPVLANVSMLLVLILGYLACGRLPVQFLPDFNPDVLLVVATRDDASAQTMQSEVMRAIEPHLYGLTGLDNIEGHAREGVCFWVLRFEVGQFNGKSIDQVNAQIAQAQLPNIKYRVERPRMRHPVLSFILHGPETLAELEAVAYSAKRELQGLGIDHVRTQGIQAPDSMLKLSSQDLHNTRLSITEVKQQVQQQLPRQVGTHKTSQAPSTSVASLEWSQQSLESQIQKILIGGVTADTLLQVVHEYPQQSPRVFWHNKPAVSMTISRDIGGSDIFTLQKVFASWQKSFEQRWGTLVSLQTYEETWRLLAFRIELLVNNGITGLILIVCVLGIIFHIVVAKWIAAGIPICIAASCIMLQILGGSINFLSTFAFVMALGIIVDDTIVIAEQAYREYENGKTPRQAVLDACQMMFLPIMAASLTTVASFMPLLAIPGEYGKIMIDIPRVIICVLLASIIECFFILPRHMRDALERLPKQMPSWQYYIQNGIAKIQFQYVRNMLVWSTKHIVFVLTLGGGLVVLPWILAVTGRIGFSFFPSPPQDIMLMDAQFHAGATERNILDFLATADTQLARINTELSAKGAPIVQVPVQFAYQRAPKSLVQFNNGKTADHASMIVGLSVPDQRSVTNGMLIEAWNNAIEQTPDLKNISITEPRAGPPVPDIKILLKGEDAQALKAAALALQHALAQYKGVHAITDNMPYGPMMLVIKPNETAKNLGLTRTQLEQQIQEKISAAEIDQRYRSGQEIDLKMQIAQESRINNAHLRQLPIMVGKQLIPLEQLASIERKQDFGNYYSFNSQPGILVTAETDATGETSRDVIADLQQRVFGEIEKNHRVSVSLATQAQSQNKALQGIRNGAVIAIVMIYGVLAWVLQSYYWPFMVMAVIPVGLSGALWGHYLLGLRISLLSIFGLFGLTGIVVNDAIILLHRFQFTNQKYPVVEAMIQACCERFRAVTLTSLTTILGMLPILFNKTLQAQFIIPLAVSISSGLLLATIVLVFLLPALTVLCGKH